MHTTEKIKKVLIFGIDGCRPDALLAANTPAVDALIKDGAYSFSAQTCELTLSGPGWTSMLTGVWPPKHHVVNNSMEGARFDIYPHFFHRLKEILPETFTASIVHWPGLHEKIVKSADVSTTYGTDSEVATEGIRLLRDTDPDILFLHFDDVDHSGHENGYGPLIQPYLDTINTIDHWIESVLETLYKRTSYDEEDWLILLSTDHGGSAMKEPGKTKARHGDNIPEHRTVFLILSGNSVLHGPIEPSPVTVDVPPTIFTHLGIEIDANWGWEGQPVGLR